MAVARRLAVAVYHMWRRCEPFDFARAFPLIREGRAM
jgi:hypothetical protein